MQVMPRVLLCCVILFRLIQTMLFPIENLQILRNPCNAKFCIHHLRAEEDNSLLNLLAFQRPSYIINEFPAVFRIS